MRFSLFGGKTKTFSSSTLHPVDLAIRTAGQSIPMKIGREEALSVPAVLRGRNLVCGSISALPLAQFGPDNRKQRNALLEQIDLDVPNIVTISQTLEDLYFEGISWWKVVMRDSTNFPVVCQHLDVNSVSLIPPTGAVHPLPYGQDPRKAVVWVDGEEVSAREVISFYSTNPGLLKSGARAIRRALLLDKAAAMYAENPRPLDYFTPAEANIEIEDDDVRDILAKWQSARKDRATAYIPSSLQYNTVDSPTPADLQLVELQRQAWLELANALGIDPEELGISTTSRTYFNAQDRRQSRINDVFAPYMRAITDRLSMGDVTRRGYRVVFDLDDYMKADATTRSQFYQSAVSAGWMTVDEVREKEGMPPLTPAQKRELKPKPAPQPTEEVQQEQSSVDASKTQLMNFNSSSRTFTVNLPTKNFSVDAETRTITGMALPYGEVGENGGLKFSFAKGSLEWSDLGRVKFLRDHRIDRAIGRAIELTDSSDGFVAKMKVSRVSEGDDALQLAEDGVLDGFSVGVEFDIAQDTVPDPKNKGVVLVRRADLREISLTAMPAFDNARVTKVAASRDGGNNMPCQTCGQVHAEGVACTGTSVNTLNQEQFNSAMDNWWAARNNQQNDGPTFVNPVRQTARTFVNEPPSYRFDRQGNLHASAHDFGMDFVRAIKSGDHVGDATPEGRRAMEFIKAQFDVVSTDINELNPTINQNRYIDQRDYRYPIWSSINKGAPPNGIQPFSWPKYSSSSGLVAAHTEGNEPSSGTFVTTNQSVTPTPISGKAKISRETWDMGGTPGISNLIWRQMQKGWFEALEAAAVSLLDAASPTQIDLSGTPGLDNEDLDQAITQAFASLQYVRGGFSMETAYAQIDLYKALVGATDSNGRRLYPAIGANNSTGTVRPRWSAIDVNGVVFYPGWALATTGVVAASSYLFDSDSVDGWATAPQRIDIERTEIANVYIGIWGYQATAINDINGVREIVYDPA